MFRSRLFPALILFAMLGIALPSFATQPPRIPVYLDGRIVQMLVVNANVFGVDQGAIDNKVAITIYTFQRRQPDVLTAGPGEPGYNPWWKVTVVIPLDGRDLSTNPFTSDSEVDQAAAAGKVLLVPTNFVFLCQVVGDNNGQGN